MKGAQCQRGMLKLDPSQTEEAIMRKNYVLIQFDSALVFLLAYNYCLKKGCACSDCPSMYLPDIE